ncbi:MAG TPA: c-type cytochrome [Bryobacteraceae bacterium]|jgi:mono/diheme cytochrome c family protein|nr:c-type cytochrome [Bryobacteraceae bacterium]
MRLIIGTILGIALVIAGVYTYFYFGWAPVATAAAPIPFEIKLAHMALHARIDKEAPRNAPFQPSQSDLENGAHLYHDHCAVCHGLIDQPQSATAKGMFPKPPKLLEGTGVTDDPPGETYWKVANGIRLTGMPAYRQSLSDKEMWQISLLLAGADKLPDPVKAILRQP